MRLLFMGTPGFAVPTLSALAQAGHDIALVVTQPDRPKGRGMRLEPPPVKLRAMELGLPVYQPEKVRRPEAVEAIKKAAPDAIVVAAFGQILPKAVLDIPPKGCYNVHASLLPAYRGAAPINWAIIRGETKTGVTIMLMDEGMDTGDMLLVEEEPIHPTDTAGALTERLSKLGAGMIVRALEDLDAGRLVRVRQEGEKATYAPMLKKETGLIDWTRPAAGIERLVRGLDPWPGAYTTLRGGTLKLWKAAVKDVPTPAPPPQAGEGKGSGVTPGGAFPGEIISADRSGILVAASEGALLVTELQAVGGRRMRAADYLAGHRVEAGERFI